MVHALRERTKTDNAVAVARRSAFTETNNGLLDASANPFVNSTSWKYSGFQVYEVHPRNRVSSGFIARNRFSSRNPVSLYFTYLESAVGGGQQMERARYFGINNQVTAIDLDVIPCGFDLGSYLRMFQENGFGRLAKTVGHKRPLAKITRTGKMPIPQKSFFLVG